jgi:ABC-type taurine transport system ATPase subunit
MLTRLVFKNFKRFGEVDIEIGKSVVFIGPNNSGKTTALQALALWELGLRRWIDKRQGKSDKAQRQGVVINRRDLTSLPVPVANLLWRDLHVRNVEREEGKPKTQNIRIDIMIEGITNDKKWSCGLEFDYANEESFYCRPLRLDDGEPLKRMPIAELAIGVKVAFLPPMSGLADREFIKQTGEIRVLIGQGQTAQVLRNLCYSVCYPDVEVSDLSDDWKELVGHILRLFGVKLLPPRFIGERSEITMQYAEKSGEGVRLDLSSAGRGLQQTLLILAYLYANPHTVLLLDEPDAHLEVLRQRQIYQLINEIAESKGSQIIAASHSEVVLNEAANRGLVIAFVGKPHLLNDRGSQAMKALTDLGWDQYYQAEQTGWVLYLEDSTDLAILKVFAKKLNHKAKSVLEMPFVHYVSTNLPQKARDHFNGLREAKPDLVGIAIFDKLDRLLQSNERLGEFMWKKREIENYFCNKEVLLAWASHDIPDDLFGQAEKEHRLQIMEKAIFEVTHLLEIDEKSPWSNDVKATDEVLDRVFRIFFKEFDLPLSFRKRDYHKLVEFITKDQIDPEVTEILDSIVFIAERAKPVN